MRSTTAIYLSVATTLLTNGTLAFQSQRPIVGFRPTRAGSSWIGSTTSPTTTQRRVALIEDASGAGSALDAFFQSQPYLAAFLTCSLKGGAADLLAQKQLANPPQKEASSPAAAATASTTSEQAQPQFDLSRNLSFVFYGGLVQGMFQQFLFSVIYPIMFGHEHTFFTTLQQVAFDVGVMPFVYLPLVYSIKSVLASQKDGGGGVSLQVIQDGLSRLVDDVANKGLLKTYWSIWIPAQTLTFSVVPPHLRVLFVAMVSFCWVTILSSVSSSASSSSSSSSSSATAPPASQVDASSPAAPWKSVEEDVRRTLRMSRGTLAPPRSSHTLPPSPASSR